MPRPTHACAKRRQLLTPQHTYSAFPLQQLVRLSLRIVLLGGYLLVVVLLSIAIAAAAGDSSQMSISDMAMGFSSFLRRLGQSGVETEVGYYWPGIGWGQGWGWG